ncbi:carbohydrate kinase [Phyllobacterium sp. BT25]|uniref:Carbohydrate kinase n=1 Tax=Phyllobacterium pellucidum TaxID=2740464 RepID=A0A849W0Z9_9HYPH|nr:FGGY-family carbohydrate kinase [Phyllobacterium pellucidum]NTS33770.1 carbohydrate kinase [Phyllobacterium pellucidum]
MTSRHNIAVLDIGKTNAKVVVVDAATGAEIAARSVANTVIREGPYPHYDVDMLWDFVVGALASFVKAPSVDAISVTTHGAAAALLGDDALAMPVIDYEYEYPESVRSAYRKLRPPFAKTSSPLLSGGLNVGAQVHFQKTEFPEAFAKVRTILTYAQYWVWRLTGIAANEVTSLGCHTDLWNPQANAYSSLVDTLGIRDLMAPIRSAFERIGNLAPAVAGKIGGDRAIPVYCGIHDSNASLLPHLMTRKSPFAVVSTGTWVVSFAVGGQLDRLDPDRDTLANVDANGHAVPSARFMGGREFDILTAGDKREPDAGTLRDVVDRRLMILPGVVNGSGPFPQRKAVWPNGEPSDSLERNSAASLYAALMTHTCLGLIGASGPTVVEGPFSRNGVYLSALRSLTSREIIALPGSTGTSLGAALLAGATCDLQQSSVMVEPLDEEFLAYAAEWRERLSDK